MPKTKTSWKKGQSGNPKGRPSKGYSISEWFREMFAADPKIKDALAKSILKKALEGDINAQKLVWNYMDGMPKHEMKLEGEVKHSLQPIEKIVDAMLADEKPTQALPQGEVKKDPNPR